MVKRKLPNLSPLESDVLLILWKNNKMRVREIYKILKQKRKVALTSIAVILDRLYERGLVDRVTEHGKGGFHYIYYPKVTRRGFEQNTIERTVNQLIENFGSSAISYFNERFSKRRRK